MRVLPASRVRQRAMPRSPGCSVSGMVDQSVVVKGTDSMPIGTLLRLVENLELTARNGERPLERPTRVGPGAPVHVASAPRVDPPPPRPRLGGIPWPTRTTTPA
jgi:hypothetical protein